MYNDIELLCNLAKEKHNVMKQTPFKFFMRAFLAGAYLGVAAILSYTLGALLVDYGPLSKIAVASSFGIGLVAIVFLKAELFTGNCFVTIMPVFKGEMRVRDLIPMWLVCYVGNIIGIGFICFLFIKSGAQAKIMTPYLKNLVEAKLDYQVFELFIKAILCNFVVCIASYSGAKIKNETSKLIVIMVLVMAFVLPGFEHCIANGGIFTMAITQLGTTVDWSMLPLHMFISTIGNIIGGSLLLALPVYIVFNEKK